MKRWKKNLAIFGSAAVLIASVPIVLVAVSHPNIPSSVVIKSDYTPVYGPRAYGATFKFGTPKEEVLDFFVKNYFDSNTVSGINLLEDLSVLFSTFMRAAPENNATWLSYRCTLLGVKELGKNPEKDKEYKNELFGEIYLTNINIDFENFLIGFDINGTLKAAAGLTTKHIDNWKIEGSVRNAKIIFDYPDLDVLGKSHLFWKIQPNENSQINVSYQMVPENGGEPVITEFVLLSLTNDKNFEIKPSYSINGLAVTIEKEKK